MLAERALAMVWHAARAEHAQAEACLEVALAAALEDEQVLSKLAARVGWKLPAGAPTITTQDGVAEGRTDITLAWASYRLVLELKVGEPPSVDQVEKYLVDGADVAAVARHTRLVSPGRGPGQFFGVVTWRTIRNLDWEDAPLALRQLHHLIDAMEVAMPDVTLAGLTGFCASWHAWQTFRTWAQGAASAISDELKGAGLHWVQRHSNRGPLSFEESSERYVAVLWPPPMRADYLKLFVGLLVGRDWDPPLVAGVPDLALTLHVNPQMELGQRLRKDDMFGSYVEKWRARLSTSPRITREFSPGPDSWEVVRARVSGLELLQSPNQETFFREWMLACAKEWVDDHVMARLAILEKETRPKVGTGAENTST